MLVHVKPLDTTFLIRVVVDLDPGQTGCEAEIHTGQDASISQGIRHIQFNCVVGNPDILMCFWALRGNRSIRRNPTSAASLFLILYLIEMILLLKIRNLVF